MSIQWLFSDTRHCLKLDPKHVVNRSRLTQNMLHEPSGADPENFERGGPEAIIYNILERGAQNPLKWLLNAHFSRFLVKSCAYIPPKGGLGLPGPLP